MLVQISEMSGFGRTFNDRELLSDLDAELNDIFAIQLYTSDTQQLQSSSEPDQVLILAINALQNEATDGMTV